jgi:hypothetical protein
MVNGLCASRSLERALPPSLSLGPSQYGGIIPATEFLQSAWHRIRLMCTAVNHIERTYIHKNIQEKTEGCAMFHIYIKYIYIAS